MTYLNGLKRPVRATALALLAIGLPAAAHAQSAEELLQSRLGTTDVGPVFIETFDRAALPVSDEMRAKAIECWKNNQCDTGTGGELTVAYADGFGENVWREVTKMEFIMQALTYPEIGHISYTSARGDAAKALSDFRAYIAQGVDVIVTFADHGEALAPSIREATESGITVVLHNGTVAGTPGEDYVTNISENICDLGKEFVKAIRTGNPDAASIAALGGTPGNPLSSTWQGCAKEEAAAIGGLDIVATEDTNWTQEGTFSAVSAILSRFDDIDGYIYDYADGFRGGVRAYQSAGKPLDIVVALRTDEQGLFCDMKAAENPNFKIFYSSGQNYQARLALTAAMMSLAGEEIPANLDVPFSMKQASVDQCDPSLPDEVSVSTMVDPDTLRAMFN
ncbi:substrate-binding domain-containing protein [Martelella mediterranea]|uniref:D-xylose ABC transporter, D-xylose-binding protein n=1 Tax=Martelella mediterranea DSM 17316 TaxID=1122214 RepID=A0A1U9YWA0_9HYPH|nr:substrate-binding domain-containing protein [Martelella mediterranea]AQZ49642.1 D-xylose ABC transporter, D-xylose-binding protein [Martelella mediterranea DSM 17316]